MYNSLAIFFLFIPVVGCRKKDDETCHHDNNRNKSKCFHWDYCFATHKKKRCKQSCICTFGGIAKHLSPTNKESLHHEVQAFHELAIGTHSSNTSSVNMSVKLLCHSIKFISFRKNNQKSLIIVTFVVV